MASTIVCGVEDATHARAAARLAVTLARRLGLRPVGVHALGAGYPHELGRPDAEAARARAHELACDILRAAGAEDPTVRVQAGPAPQLLAAAAADADAAFLVVGTRGAGLVRSAVLGSVSTAVLRLAPCPVIVVPPAAVEHGIPPLGGGVLVAGVGAAEDAAWVPMAARLAHVLDSRLLLAHVLEDADDPDEWFDGIGPRARALAEALMPACRAASQTPIGAETRVRQGDPGDELAHLARVERASMLVVGSRGHGALRAGLMGSVSGHLAREAGAPVVICPHRTAADAGRAAA